jgi:hypothetical protein
LRFNTLIPIVCQYYRSLLTPLNLCCDLSIFCAFDYLINTSKVIRNEVVSNTGYLAGVEGAGAGNLSGMIRFGEQAKFGDHASFREEVHTKKDSVESSVDDDDNDDNKLLTDEEIRNLVESDYRKHRSIAMEKSKERHFVYRVGAEKLDLLANEIRGCAESAHSEAEFVHRQHILIFCEKNLAYCYKKTKRIRDALLIYRKMFANYLDCEGDVNA